MPLPLRAGASQRLAALVLAGGSLIGGAALGSLFLGTARDSWAAVAAPGPAGPADGLLLVIGLGGTSLSLWLGLGMTLSALSALPGALGRLSLALAGRVAPVALRRVVAFLLGTTLTAALVPGTALAGGAHESLRPAVVATARHARSDLAVAAPDASFRFVEERPPDAVRRSDITDVNNLLDAAPVPAWSAPRAGRPSQEIVVLRGDTLWSIAAHHLGPAAGAAQIDAEWRRWLAVNSDVIGDDPNLILPGQLLRPPPSLPAQS